MATTGEIRRAHASERLARKNGYPNAQARVIKDLGKTTTEIAKDFEASHVRKLRKEGA